MAAPSLVPTFDSPSRRALPRYPIEVSLDVIALQSGIPNSMPGRCCDLSEAGLAAVIAGEVIAGQSVAIEMHLPNVGLPVRARAQVRYQERLRCGLQFVGLSLDQREKIRYWASQTAPPTRTPPSPLEVAASDQPVLSPAPADEDRTRKFRLRRRRLLVLVVLIFGLAAFGWWQWQKAWNQIESHSTASAVTQSGLPLRVPSEVMDGRIVYKVDPVYPDSARQEGLQGLVVLDAVIARDGTVKRLHPIAGPQSLSQAALDAVQSWRYTPYHAEGRPVEVETTVSVDFRLH
jgi:TonB family protein